MWRLGAVVALPLLLLSAPARAAEHDFPAPQRDRADEERVSLSLTNRAGLVQAPFGTSAFPKVSGFADLLTFTGAVQVAPVGWLRPRLPLGLVRLDFPAGAQVSKTTLGNVELAIEHRLELRRTTRVELLAALLVPSAQHGPRMALLDNRALALSSALNGGKDASLLTPGVTGLRVGVSVEHWVKPFALRASLELPLLVRVSEASLPVDARTHPVGMLPALELRAAWWATAWFGASLGGALVTEPWRVQEPARERDRNRRAQPMVELGLHFQIGKHVTLGLEGSVAVGGNLGGKAWSVAPGARVAF